MCDGRDGVARRVSRTKKEFGSTRLYRATAVGNTHAKGAASHETTTWLAARILQMMARFVSSWGEQQITARMRATSGAAKVNMGRGTHHTKDRRVHARARMHMYQTTCARGKWTRCRNDGTTTTTSTRTSNTAAAPTRSSFKRSASSVLRERAHRTKPRPRMFCPAHARDRARCLDRSLFHFESKTTSVIAWKGSARVQRESKPQVVAEAIHLQLQLTKDQITTAVGG